MPAFSAKRKIATRRISDLRPHPRQADLFPPASPEELQELADDIKRNGLAHPIEITAAGVIICGHQRVEAARLLGWEEVRCWVRADLDSEEAVEQRLIEDNLHRRQMGKLAIARCYQRLKQLPGGAGKQRGAGDFRDVLGKRFHVTGRTLDNWVQLLKAPVEIQQAFDAGKLSLTDAIKIVALPSKKQQAVVQGILAGQDPKRVVRQHVGVGQRQQPDIEAEFTRLLRSLHRGHEKLADKEIPASVLSRPGVRVGIRRGRKLLRRLLDAINGEQAPGKASSGGRRTRST